ncbi:odorant receptor 63a-like [Glossina fuscipes]|uniref:Odorant receptor n=1 Tax=Glossina fuscipes TaxID=7396 RepID=A0A9C5ZPS5_9MUSC|nr:odorant receptor 63a-like [Glossina fuscipes]
MATLYQMSDIGSAMSNECTGVTTALIVSGFVGLIAVYNFIRNNLNESINVYADSLLISMQIIISNIKLIHLIFMQHEFYKVIKQAENSDIILNLNEFGIATNGQKKLMQNIKDILKDSWQDIHRQLRFFIYSCCAIVGWYWLVALAQNIHDLYKRPEYFTVTTTFPVKYPHWISKGPMFIIHPVQYINSAACNHISGFGAVCYDGIYVVLVVHCAALVHLLRALVEHSTTNEVPQARRVQYILGCIKFYQKIFEFYSSIDGLFRTVNLTQYCINAIILCMIIFQASIGLEAEASLVVKMFLYLMAISFQNIMYCYNGEKLITQSNLLPTAWYSCCWYNESAELKFLIRMMILRTNRALYMKMSGFSTMSLMTMLTLYQTSSSYFLLLRNVSADR